MSRALHSARQGGPSAKGEWRWTVACVLALAVRASGAPVLPECTERDTTGIIFAADSLVSGEIASIPLVGMEAAHELWVDVLVDSDNDRVGAGFDVYTVDGIGEKPVWKHLTAYGTREDSLWERGDAGPLCGHPEALEVKCTIWSGRFEITAWVVERPGWNRQTTDFDTAPPVGRASTWCGSINGVNGCENDGVWRIDLAPGDTLDLALGLTGSERVGAAAYLELYSPDRELLRWLIGGSAYGRQDRTATYVHTGEAGTHYLVLNRTIWDLFAFRLALELRSPPPPVTIEMVPDDSVVVVSPGGSFGFTATIASAAEDSVRLEGWTEAELAGPGLVTPVLGPVPVDLAPGEEWVVHGVQGVPLGVGPGTATYRGVIGLAHPVATAVDEFEVTVSP